MPATITDFGKNGSSVLAYHEQKSIQRLHNKGMNTKFTKYLSLRQNEFLH